MLVPPTEGLRVAKYAEGAGYAPDQWARALAAVDWDRAQLLSDKPDSSVWRAELVVQKRPMTLVIKCEPIEGLKRKLQKLVHKTHAFRHWRGAELLVKHGFRTAEPKAVVYGRRDGVEIECLIMEALAGKTVLAHLAAGNLGVREEHAVARACGRLAIDLMLRHVPNPDLKLSNLIVVEATPPVAKLAMIDCIGVGRKAHALDMMAIQLIEPLGAGVAPRRALRSRVIRSGIDLWQNKAKRNLDGTLDNSGGAKKAFARTWWREIEHRVVAHGDPTPEHDPLGRASGTSPERE